MLHLRSIASSFCFALVAAASARANVTMHLPGDTTISSRIFPWLVIPAKAGIRLLSSTSWISRCARPFGAVLRMFCALRAGPAFAGMTSRQESSTYLLDTTPEPVICSPW
jgi:hypothetical protein